MMAAFDNPCRAFSFRTLHTRRVFCRPRPQRLPNSTARTDRLFLVHQRRLWPCVLRSQDLGGYFPHHLEGYFPHHQDGVLNRQRYEKSIASAGRINSGEYSPFCNRLDSFVSDDLDARQSRSRSCLLICHWMRLMPPALSCGQDGQRIPPASPAISAAGSRVRSRYRYR